MYLAAQKSLMMLRQETRTAYRRPRVVTTPPECIKEVKTVQTKTQMKTIVVRKPGSVRLTARCNNYCYGNCCCL